MSISFLLCLHMLQTILNRNLIPKSPQPTYNRRSLVTQPALLPEIFPCMHITDMYLHKRNVNSQQSISQCNTVMRKRCRIDHYSIDTFRPCLMDPVEEGAFPVRLEEGECCAPCGSLCYGA